MAVKKVKVDKPLKPVAPPKDHKVAKNRWWCPYCAKDRKFPNDGRLGVKRCEECQISENDFYVRNYNKLWKA